MPKEQRKLLEKESGRISERRSKMQERYYPIKKPQGMVEEGFRRRTRRRIFAFGFSPALVTSVTKKAIEYFMIPWQIQKKVGLKKKNDQ